MLEIYHNELKKNAQLRDELEKGAGDSGALKRICDIADAMYYNNPNNEMIWEVFNLAAECVGIRRRLPDEPDFE